MPVQAYCLPAELRTQIEKDGTTGSASDAALMILIKAASQVIDRYFNRPDGYFKAEAIGTARYFAGLGKPYIIIDDFASYTQVAVKDSPTDTTYTVWVDGTDYQAFSGDPLSPNFNDTPYTGFMCLPGGDYTYFTSGRYGSTPRGFRPHPDDGPSLGRSVPTVRVTAVWGWATTPPDSIKAVTIGLAARWFKRGQSSWADAVAATEMGTLLYSSREYSDLKMMLESLRMFKPAIGR